MEDLVGQEFVSEEDFEARLRAKIVEGELSEVNFKRIMCAFRLAQAAHKGQESDDGTPYIRHPIAVTLILIDEFQIFDMRIVCEEECWGLEQKKKICSCVVDALCAALLHDVKEDNESFMKLDDFEFIWGENVKDMVDILSKDTHMEDKVVRDKLYKRRLRKAIRLTRIIKFADRIHNLRTLSNSTFEKQKRVVWETQRNYLWMAKDTHIYSYRIMKDLCDRYTAKFEEISRSRGWWYGVKNFLGLHKE